MFEARILLRSFLLLTAALVFTTCNSSSTTTIAPSPGGGTQGRSPCGAGVGVANRNAPIVCVDDTGDTLKVHPDPIGAYAVGEGHGQPVVLHWWTRSGGNTLNLEIQEGCVTDLKCTGGHCTARTLPKESRTQCKYDVWTDKHPKLDPDIIVDPCC